MVDVGGDALTDGDDPGLSSPLADQLAIAACLRTEMPARLLIAGPGLDGEVDPTTLRQRLKSLHSQRLADLSPRDLDSVRSVLTWHPSEASGLLFAAADGHRGYVQIRDAGTKVALTDDTVALQTVDLHQAATITPAAALTDTRTLDDAEHVIDQITGISEIRYETEKAARRNGERGHTVSPDDLHQIDQLADQAAQNGADYISMRRLSELVGATTLSGFADLGRLLAAARPARYGQSIYRVN